jgi:uncharacterized protein (UPF0333 family)
MKMENKGQASAEYLLLLVVLLIILASVTIPLVANSVNASMDVSKSSDTKNALQSIANAVNIVYANGPGSKRTIDIYMPQNGNISVNNNQPRYIYQLLVLSSQNKTINASIDSSIVILNPSPQLTAGWHKTQIEWPINGSSNSNITVKFLT